MSDWDDLVEPARGALEALLRKGDAMADRIEELEAHLLSATMDGYDMAKHEYRDRIEELEAKLAKTAHFIVFLDENYRHVFGDTARKKIRSIYAELKGNTDG